MSNEANEKLDPNAIENITWCVGQCEVLYRQLGDLQTRLCKLQREHTDILTMDMPRAAAADKLASVSDEYKAICSKLVELAK